MKLKIKFNYISILC